jgi:hypothetical protein
VGLLGDTPPFRVEQRQGREAIRVGRLEDSWSQTLDMQMGPTGQKAVGVEYGTPARTYCSIISSGNLSKAGSASAMMTGFLSIDERGRSRGATSVIADGARSVGWSAITAAASRRPGVSSCTQSPRASSEKERGLGVTGRE